MKQIDVIDLNETAMVSDQEAAEVTGGKGKQEVYLTYKLQDVLISSY